MEELLPQDYFTSQYYKLMDKENYQKMVKYLNIEDLHLLSEQLNGNLNMQNLLHTVIDPLTNIIDHLINSQTNSIPEMIL